MARTAKLCPGCNATLTAPSITPSTTRRGWCTDCAPNHTTHLSIPGDHSTLCGKFSHETNRPNVTVQMISDFGPNNVNCNDCTKALARRNRR